MFLFQMFLFSCWCEVLVWGETVVCTKRSRVARTLKLMLHSGLVKGYLIVRALEEVIKCLHPEVGLESLAGGGRGRSPMRWYRVGSKLALSPPEAYCEPEMLHKIEIQPNLFWCVHICRACSSRNSGENGRNLKVGRNHDVSAFPSCSKC